MPAPVMQLVDLHDGSDRLWLTDGHDFGMYADMAPRVLWLLERVLLHLEDGTLIHTRPLVEGLAFESALHAAVHQANGAE